MTVLVDDGDPRSHRPGDLILLERTGDTNGSGLLVSV
jgi:hypothetical protein